MDIDARSEGTTLTVSGAARVLGVHANTIRAWTDQGRLPCIRINDRGDRRYRTHDLSSFLDEAGLRTAPVLPFQSRLGRVASRRLSLVAEPADRAAMPGSTPDHAATSPSGGPNAGGATDHTAAAGAPDPRWLALVAGLAGGHARGGDLDATLRSALRRLRDTGRYSMIAIGRWQGDRLTAHLTEGSHRARAWWKAVDPSLARSCCMEERPLAASVSGSEGPGRRGAAPDRPEIWVFTPIGAGEDAWGVLITQVRSGVTVDASHLDLLAAVGGVLSLAVQAGMATRNARDLERTARWAAQLQSIQALGARLARLSTVTEIGQAICIELRQLIEYHNVRVYRVEGEDVVPIAWRGEIGEYTGEQSEQLRLKVGHGITGWVAAHGAAEYLPDASADPRSETIPGTEDDLDESMLLAPIHYEDRVIGVIVLSKLGLDRFTQDDLRYLEIYASMAGQALVNADAAEQLRAQSERLERQLETQRELIRVTESILSSLDPRTVVAEIADRLGTLVPVDTLGLDLYETATGRLVPLYATGVHADQHPGRTPSQRRGVATWVARHGEAQLVQDELADPRVAHLDDGPEAGALIVAPLHGREGVTGILTLERLGAGARFASWEFELVTLFAGHVSIALANAVAHHAVEMRAMTDALTGLKNHGTFADQLARTVSRGIPFSLLMLDLDDFKSYNDRDGHEAGNRLLQAISRGIEAAVRESDDVFRYGGDEFAVILPHTTGAGALEVARKVGAAVAAVDGGSVTCSIGVATYPEDAPDRDGVLLAADRACYAAKRSGRGRVATAAEARELPPELQIPPPTPVDELPLPSPARH
jgi:diguanylate cyclase (GGDEF)-like protein/excisionase family DNA binding protein